MKRALGAVVVSLCGAACVVSYEGGPVAGEAVASFPQTTGPKKRIGVVEFTNNSGYGGPQLARAASDAVAEFLVKSKAFLVFERARMAAVMKEQALSMSGAVSAETAVKAGELMGLNAIVVGNIEEASSSRVTVRIRLIDTTTANILLADSGTSEGGDTTRRTLNAALVKLINNIFSTMEAQPWTGRVAMVDSGRVYINAGTAVGIKAGDRFEIREGGKPIKDPVTKMIIGYSRGNMKGKLQAADVQAEVTGCISTGGAGFAVGDPVTLLRGGK